MRRLFVFILGTLLATSVVAKPRLQLILSPNGGFHPENKKPMRLHDGTEVPPNLNDMATDMIKQVRKGGRVEIAMYAFSDMDALEAMVDRARGGATVQLVLDACASWTTDLRKMLFEKLEKHEGKAKKDGVPFDFQVKTIDCDTFVRHGRAKRLSPSGKVPEGKLITGTMHEKIGIFFLGKRKTPSHAFAGSSNFARSAATRYAENRTFFWDDPVSAWQLHEEFQRLWKYWGECAFGDCEELGKIRDVEAGSTDVQMVFNGEPLSGGDPGDPAEVEKWRRIDYAIHGVLDELEPDGTIDFAMFSFTHWPLMNHLLRAAQKNPKARVRVLLDLSMMAADNPDRPGVLGPLMELRAEEMGLTNFEVRYKWRSNAHSYDPENAAVPPGLYHFKSDLLHHKMVIVNGDVLVNGSYNWSSGAEHRNLENIQIFRRSRGHDAVIDAFLREYDYIWSAPRPDDPELKDEFRENPQVVPGPAGRALQDRIIEVLRIDGVKEIQFAFDEVWGNPLSVRKLASMTGLPYRKLRKLCEKMREVTLLRRTGRNEYAYAD